MTNRTRFTATPEALHTEIVDVLIIGAGLAGLTLSRQLLLNSDKRILLLDKRAQVPTPRQKVGESTVQFGAYYYSKVLDLEEYLLSRQYMKYNLRFYWKSADRDNSRFEDYGQSYIRTLSNIVCYQLDRNTFEAELLRRNRQFPNFALRAPVADVHVEFAPPGSDPHTVRFTEGGRGVRILADWVVDTSGRGKVLKRQLGLTQQNPIRHGASFTWVDGLVDIEKMTDRSPGQIRRNPNRAETGHVPLWLATNHFMGEGLWFWVIPLQGKTSLGLVYDNRLQSRDQFTTPEKLIDWACREFPLFARDLPQRKILDFSALRDFSYGSQQTISESRWALSGEAGRFTDPLYSPGSDLISLHNTLITDAILNTAPGDLAAKCRLYEILMRVFYQATVPGYSVTYDLLGDQESFAMKYTWELAIYFGFYVFPFINDLFTDGQFIPQFLRAFSRLGPLNSALQSFLHDYYHWKKAELRPPGEPRFFDFTSVAALRGAERTFYQVGAGPAEATRVLDGQFENLRELARYFVAYVSSVVLDDEQVVNNLAFVEGIDFGDLTFEPEAIRARYALCPSEDERYPWSFDTTVLERLRSDGRRVVAPAATNGVVHA
jgi:flavin-dependent dehydrogenase